MDHSLSNWTSHLEECLSLLCHIKTLQFLESDLQIVIALNNNTEIHMLQLKFF